MWGLYHKLRTSPSFKAQWTIFGMKAIGKNPPVGFYQFVTHEIFKQMIKEEFPVNIMEHEAPSNPLTPGIYMINYNTCLLMEMQI